MLFQGQALGSKEISRDQRCHTKVTNQLPPEKKVVLKGVNIESNLHQLVLACQLQFHRERTPTLACLISAGRKILLEF